MIRASIFLPLKEANYQREAEICIECGENLVPNVLDQAFFHVYIYIFIPVFIIIASLSYLKVLKVCRANFYLLFSSVILVLMITRY
ncbi:hypothetical protein NEF87_002379 [Candidatus Lokiarchaeum ossiferum]|uniref:Uncharacterized protein n=1 Tax=Candidatus Lokiarchaeum ossiferum TaxID=2951803 RepID=A0ABY6HUG5_9ARCH|nr:hypothetical protein NEF87_002379 [Candidatus Lokiarchaeum sp. B-35]